MWGGPWDLPRASAESSQCCRRRRGTGKILAHFSDSPIGLLHGAATLPAASRPDSGGRPPLALRNSLRPCGHEHEGGVPARKGADRAGAPADLLVQVLDGVARADPPPALAGEPRVGQGLGIALADGLRGIHEPHGLQLASDGERLVLGTLASTLR